MFNVGAPGNDRPRSELYIKAQLSPVRRLPSRPFFDQQSPTIVSKGDFESYGFKMSRTTCLVAGHAAVIGKSGYGLFPLNSPGSHCRRLEADHECPDPSPKRQAIRVVESLTAEKSCHS